MTRCDRNFASGAAWEEQPGIDDLRTAPRGAVRGEYIIIGVAIGVAIHVVIYCDMDSDTNSDADDYLSTVPMARALGAPGCALGRASARQGAPLAAPVRTLGIPDGGSGALSGASEHAWSPQ